MPMIECTLIKGYDQPTRQLVAERLTDAACATIGAHPDLVIVTINEVDGENYMRGRTNKTPATAPVQPDRIIRQFLDAMEQRDLVVASGFLDNDFEMVYPGNKRFQQLDELVAWAKTRYKSVQKTYEGFDSSFQGSSTTVTCFGTLSGTWLDGMPFESIRFIDRFTLENGKIKSQSVWNDLGETAKEGN